MEAMFRVHDGGDLLRGDIQHKGIEGVGDFSLSDDVNVPPGIFRSGEFLLIAVQPKSIVDTLAEDPAQAVGAFQNQDVFRPMFVGRSRRGHPGASAAYNQDVHLPHGATSSKRWEQDSPSKI